MTYKTINRHTRARKDGTIIQCPCGVQTVVYHFAWVALRCVKCERMTEKHEWVVVA